MKLKASEHHLSICFMVGNVATCARCGEGHGPNTIALADDCLTEAGLRFGLIYCWDCAPLLIEEWRRACLDEVGGGKE